MTGAEIPYAVKKAPILIVDDEVANVRLIEIILEQSGFTNIVSTTNSGQAINLFHETHPDLVLLDLHMPAPDGFEVMAQIKALNHHTYLPILVLTADATTEARQRALTEGAKDFLTKPVDRTEVLLRVTNLLETRLQNNILEEKVRDRTRNLEEAQLETLHRLALAAEYRDDDTGTHTRRVGLNAVRLAQALGLPRAVASLVEQAAPLHDVGKIGIPDHVLLKPGRLTPEEFEVIKTHTTMGAEILSGSSSPWLQLAEVIALSHHERWDGSGYPQGLSGDEIPEEGRIVAIVDVFDALTHDRPYKKAWTTSEALAEIEAQKGRQFDPEVVDAFMRLSHEVQI